MEVNLMDQSTTKSTHFENASKYVISAKLLIHFHRTPHYLFCNCLFQFYSHASTTIPFGILLLERARVLLPRLGRPLPLDDDAILRSSSPLHFGNLLPCNLGTSNAALAINHMLLLAG